MQKILRIDASARQGNSYSRALADMLIDKLETSIPNAYTVKRNIYKDTLFLSEVMVEGMASAESIIRDAHLSTLSDSLIQELISSDILVLAVPVYNFSIPAALKAYIDLVVRAGRTFQYDSGGQRGLVDNLKVWIILTSNGTPMHGEGDFASSYLEYILRFIGIRNIQFIDGTQMLSRGADTVMKEAEIIMDECLQLHPLS